MYLKTFWPEPDLLCGPVMDNFQRHSMISKKLRILMRNQTGYDKILRVIVRVHLRMLKFDFYTASPFGVSAILDLKIHCFHDLQFGKYLDYRVKNLLTQKLNASLASAFFEEFTLHI